jgi:hypothetical protein
VADGAPVDASLGASCSFSIRRNRRRAIAKGMGMVRRALLRLARGNAGEAPLPGAGRRLGAGRPPPRAFHDAAAAGVSARR